MNKKDIEEFAYQQLIKSNIKKLPINIYKIIKNSHAATVVYSYDYIAIGEKVHGFSYDKLLETFGHACIFYSEETQVYHIGVDTRCDFTTYNEALCHEIAHVIFSHVPITKPISIKNRDSIIEYQARTFAECFLAPDPVLIDAQVNQPNEISHTCHITLDTATKKAKGLKYRSVFELLYAESLNEIKGLLRIQFSDFISRYLSKKNRTELSPELFPYDLLAEMEKRIS